jgi:mediator of RNA polymerase II transcription subunit 6
MAAPQPDLSETCWRDDLFMQSYGLSHASILDYFALSPFYDRACNNEAARQRGLRLEQLQYAAPASA